MNRFVLEYDELRLEIDPSLGAGIANLTRLVPGSGWVSLMRPSPANASWFNDLACYVLAPWSNRIADATFAWHGHRIRLPVDWPDGTAIHGLVKDKPWMIVQRSPVSALLRRRESFAFPWPFSVDISYELAASFVRVWLRLTHEAGGSRMDPMPAGVGFHPFWRRSLSGGPDDVTVTLPGLRRYPCDRMIPTASAAEDDVTHRLATGTILDLLTLDDVFAGSADGAIIRWPREGLRVTYRCSDSLGHTVIFTGMPGSFCLEPVSMVNDGFNLLSRGRPDTGVPTLAPGQVLEAHWSMHIDAE